MAQKKNLSSEPDDNEFRISKTKIGKETIVTVTFQLTELQEAHLSRVCTANEVARAEFCKQAVAFALRRLKEPLPAAGEASEETLETLEARREKRAARAAKRA